MPSANNPDLSGARSGIRIQSLVAFTGIVIFITKLLAWAITNSNALFTDALESTANIVAGLFGLYSLRVASKPSDEDHPYGHGKIEFISASIEGSLIGVAGIIILVKSTYNLFYPNEIYEIQQGLILSAITGTINLGLGIYVGRKALKLRSETLLASSAHLKSDAYTTIALIAGLILVQLTGRTWLDSALAIGFGVYIVIMSVRILQRALSGIMDAADFSLLSKLVAALEARRKPDWIDIHNMRLIKYGSSLHMDCHVTVPWYYTVAKAHDEVEEINKIVDKVYGERVELFIHIDPCVPESCPSCLMENCDVRRAPFVKRHEWTVKNLVENRKHID